MSMNILEMCSVSSVLGFVLVFCEKLWCNIYISNFKCE